MTGYIITNKNLVPRDSYLKSIGKTETIYTTRGRAKVYEDKAQAEEDVKFLSKGIAKHEIDEVVIPEVGMGASYGAGSDSYPATIVEVSPDKKTIWVTSDSSTPTKDSDFYNGQSYTYETNWDAERTCYTLRKNGSWIRKGQPMKAYWCSIGIGVRRKHIDPHF